MVGTTTEVAVISRKNQQDLSRNTDLVFTTTFFPYGRAWLSSDDGIPCVSSLSKQYDQYLHKNGCVVAHMGHSVLRRSAERTNDTANQSSTSSFFARSYKKLSVQSSNYKYSQEQKQSELHRNL
mmetsp:Transcript_1316/g.3340  ORF Transcript_1316/g.3340 Transcript_1316/m.3340 type:complete len:124 (+) Transcript_1316:1535-1906(+)